jgi:ribosomal protein S18 acetylase RimI-like enzyme
MPDDVIRVRRAEVGDAADLVELAGRTFMEAYRLDTAVADLQAFIDEHYTLAQEAANLADPAVFVGLAESSGRLIGYVDTRVGDRPPVELAGHRPCLLHRLYVDATAQGLGVGRLLFDWCVAEARRRDRDVVWLSVWERNPRAIAIYERWGFVDVGGVSFLVGNDEQRDRIMARPLH